MATLPKDHPFNGMTGTLGGNLIFKNYQGKTVISKKPDMRMAQKNLSPLQKINQIRFKEAVAYARSIIKDIDKKTAFAADLPIGKTVFNAAIQDYLSKHKP